MSAAPSDKQEREARRFRITKTNALPKRTLFGSDLEITDRSQSVSSQSSVLPLPQEEVRRRALLQKPQPKVPAEWDSKYLQPLRERLEKSKAEYARVEKKFSGNANTVIVMNEFGQAAAGNTDLMDHLWRLTERANELELDSHFDRNAALQPTYRNTGSQINEADLMNADMKPMRSGDESEDNELNFFRKAADSANIVQRQHELGIPQTIYANDYQVWSPTNLQPERLFKNKLKARKIVTINPDDLPKNIWHRENDPNMVNWMKSEDFKTRLNHFESSQRKPSEKALMYEKVRTERTRIPPLQPCDQTGVLLRSNLFPGSLYKQPKIGMLKQAHNDEVFKQRDTAVPNTYRHQRDKTTKWTEESILADRQKRAWDIYFMERKAKSTSQET